MYRKLRQLPIECVQPAGWLKEQLQIQANGLSGKLYDLWDSTGSYSGWLGGSGEDWERGPYYIDGLFPLAYYTQDAKLQQIALSFIRWTLDSQGPDGNFGPPSTQQDWWSRVVMLKALIQYYEVSGDTAVLDLMEAYFEFMNRTIDANPITQWGRARVADLLYCILRLQQWRKLDCSAQLCHKLNQQSLDWNAYLAHFPFPRPAVYYYNWQEISKHANLQIPQLMQYHSSHIVNVTMGLKYPAIQYMLTGQPHHREILRQGVEDLIRYHGVVTGMINGDEHLSGPNPTQGTELCAVAEYMFSLEIILEAFGDAAHGDTLERIAYNALPATITEDFMAHQYLQQVNQISATQSKRNWFNNQDDAITFGLEPHFGCCTANMHQAWPKLLRGLWYEKDAQTLVAMAYAPCVVRWQTEQQQVVIRQVTDYPFGESIQLEIEADGVDLGLWMRIPGWCKAPSITVNGETVGLELQQGFAVLRRRWQTGDRVVLHLPMEVETSRWYRNSIGITRGPLVYGLEMEEQWSVVKTVAGIHDYEVRSDTPWNYAISSLENIEVTRRPVSAVPFSKSAPPIALELEARPVEGWTAQGEMAGEIPQSPVPVTAPPQRIRLIPYGCTNLRIAQFPTTFEGDGSKS